MKSFDNVFSFFLMEMRYKFEEGAETSALSCNKLNLNTSYPVTFQFSQKKAMIYLYRKCNLNEIRWNALNTTPHTSYYVIIILANLLLLLIQELILRYLRKKKNRRGRRKSTYIADLNYITSRRTFPI